MGIILNRRRVMGGSKLPYDAEIEYLKSTGTQYIDTDIRLSSMHIIDIEFTHINGNRLVGARNSSVGAGFGIYNECVDVYTGASDRVKGRLPITCTEGVRYKVHAQNGNRKLMDKYDNIIQQNTFIAGAFNITRNTPIFALRWDSDNVTSAAGCIHSISITYKGDSLIDFIPVRIGTAGYMYDKVSGKLFGNAGTGDFILGPDV